MTNRLGKGPEIVDFFFFFIFLVLKPTLGGPFTSRRFRGAGCGSEGGRPVFGRNCCSGLCRQRPAICAEGRRAVCVAHSTWPRSHNQKTKNTQTNKPKIAPKNGPGGRPEGVAGTRRWADLACGPEAGAKSPSTWRRPGTDPAQDGRSSRFGAVAGRSGRGHVDLFEPVHPATGIPRRCAKCSDRGPMGGWIGSSCLRGGGAPVRWVWCRFRAFVGDRPVVRRPQARTARLPSSGAAGSIRSFRRRTRWKLGLAGLTPNSIAQRLESLAEVMDFAKGSPEVIALIRVILGVAGTGHTNALYDGGGLHLRVRQRLTRTSSTKPAPGRPCEGPACGRPAGGSARQAPARFGRGRTRRDPDPARFPGGARKRPSAGNGVDRAWRESTARRSQSMSGTSGRQWRPGQGGGWFGLVSAKAKRGGGRPAWIEATDGDGEVPLGLGIPGPSGPGPATGRRGVGYRLSHTPPPDHAREGDRPGCCGREVWPYGKRCSRVGATISCARFGWAPAGPATTVAAGPDHVESARRRGRSLAWPDRLGGDQGRGEGDFEGGF